MSATFGARLRLQREQQQISLPAISEQTKIKLSLLEALERDDFSHWPGGLFGRSYIRAYAQAVGLDPNATVREFVECQQGRIDPAASELTDIRELSPEKKATRRPPTRLEFLIDSAIDAFHARRADISHRGGPSVAEPPPAFAYAESVAPRATQVDTTPLPSTTPMRSDVHSTAIDMAAVARLCTRLGCAREGDEVTTALEDAVGILDAVGLVLWMPDSLGVTLTPVFAHGYSDEVIAQTVRMSSDANNATAEAFRTMAVCIVNGSELRTGALVAPLLTPMGCAGVLSVELRDLAEQRDDVRAAVTILAAQISTVMGFSVLAHTLSA